jgi:uncharacterized protein YggT (Ycf19 family)
MNPVLAQWWFHLPNFILAALMYTLIGRFMLSFIFEPNATNFIWRFFVRTTDPVLRAVAFVTPQAVPPAVIILFSIVWLFALRILLIVLFAALGSMPTTGVTAT